MHVLILGVPLYEGMAGSVRVRNLLDPLVKSGKVTWSNLFFSKQAGNFSAVGLTNAMEVDVDLKRPFSVFRFLRQSFGFIKRQFSKDGLNVFYAYDTPDAKTILLILYAKMLGYKVVLDIVEDNQEAISFDGVMNSLRIKSGVYFLKKAALFADLVIVISSHLENKLKAIFKDERKVFYIPITVDLGRIAACTSYKQYPEKVFYGGSFGKKDGLDTLIKAFSSFSKQFPDAELILTGKGENMVDFESIMSFIHARDGKSNINYLGFLSSAEYEATLAACDVFCVTRNNSGAANTGFPSKLGEYLASGKAVVASAVGDVPHVLQNGVDSILVTPEDETALYNALIRLFSEPGLLESLGKNARKVAKKNFDNTVQSERLYNRLLTLAE